MMFLNDHCPWITAAVPIEIVSRHVALNAHACDAVERRLAHALGRFARRVQSIHVLLSNEHARQESDTICRIEMRTSWHTPIVVTASDRHLGCAITKSAHVAARRLDELFTHRQGA